MVKQIYSIETLENLVTGPNPERGVIRVFGRVKDYQRWREMRYQPVLMKSKWRLFDGYLVDEKGREVYFSDSGGNTWRKTPIERTILRCKRKGRLVLLEGQFSVPDYNVHEKSVVCCLYHLQSAEVFSLPAAERSFDGGPYRSPGTVG